MVGRRVVGVEPVMRSRLAWLSPNWPIPSRALVCPRQFDHDITSHKGIGGHTKSPCWCGMPEPAGFRRTVVMLKTESAQGK